MIGRAPRTPVPTTNRRHFQGISSATERRRGTASTASFFAFVRSRDRSARHSRESRRRSEWSRTRTYRSALCSP
jgi:hypothetical protein